MSALRVALFSHPMRPPLLLALFTFAAACTGDAPATSPPDAGPPPEFRVEAPAEWLPPLRDYAAETMRPRLGVASGAASLPTIRVLHDLDCRECYRLERLSVAAGSRAWAVHAGDALGAQYGLTHLLEGFGFRYFHPTAPARPWSVALDVDDPALFGPQFAPEQRVRGMQLHTLHPIEALDLWTPGERSLANAKAVIDWFVKNRGNYLQVVALDDIQRQPDLAEAWRPHARAIVAYAHRRGLRMGVGIQLFGRSNLQRAFDLLDQENLPDPRAEMRARLHVLMDDVGWDVINLSFGEFTGSTPDTFIARVNDLRAVVAELSPGTEVSATVHVGDSPSQRVEHQGRSLLYYFLVRFTDPTIVPWVHTVMYYPLNGPAGGAYHHADFDEHRDYIIERLRAGQRVAYFPESAYWIAFDNSVPAYLPVYVRTRYDDLAGLRATARAGGFADLSEHILFSSGWEWGYWQTDAAVLRMGYRLPARWGDVMDDFFSPWGDGGRTVARQITRLGDLQHDALITRALGPYLAGREAVLDAGEGLGIVAQPPRPSFASVAALDAAGRAAFLRDVVAPLQQHATDTEGVLAAVTASGADLGDPWIAEVRDGVAVDALRARFAAVAWEAAARFGEGGRAGAAPALVAQLDELLAGARVVVARRHRSLHWNEPERLLTRVRNPTFYQHGYLFYAGSLCFWERERVQLQALVNGSTASPPGCVL